MHAFVSWHRRRHAEDLSLVEQYFDVRAFAAELAALPGAYAPPRGCLLLAFHEGQAAGCVALRALDLHTCEMKRMFVYPQFQGKGVGRALATAVIRQARAFAYRTMRLDTSIRQREAQRLYTSLGFKQVAPYATLSTALTNWLVFMELPLDAAISEETSRAATART